MSRREALDDWAPWYAAQLERYPESAPATLKRPGAPPEAVRIHKLYRGGGALLVDASGRVAIVPRHYIG